MGIQAADSGLAAEGGGRRKGVATGSGTSSPLDKSGVNSSLQIKDGGLLCCGTYPLADHWVLPFGHQYAKPVVTGNIIIWSWGSLYSNCGELKWHIEVLENIGRSTLWGQVCTRKFWLTNKAFTTLRKKIIYCSRFTTIAEAHFVFFAHNHILIQNSHVYFIPYCSSVDFFRILPNFYSLRS